MTANPPSSGGSSVGQQSPDNFRVIRKRNRIPVSCGPCRNRKLKCNRQHPCENCLKRDDVASCNYASVGARSRRSNVSGDKASPDDMQARIDRLEGLVLSLMGSGNGSRRNSKDDEHEEDESSMHMEETTSEGTNNEDNDFIKPEVEDDVEDVRSQLGFMKVEQGKSMYRGSSHWALVLNEIAEVKNYFTAACNKERFDQMAQKQEKMKYNSISTSFPFSVARSLSRDEILQALPPRRIVDKLLDHWFEAYDRSYHILHGPTFRKEYETFWKDPNGPKADLTWIGFLFAILMTSIVDLAKLDKLEGDPELLKLDPDTFKVAIEHCLIIGINATKPTLYTIQAGIVYIACLRTRDNIEQMWLYVGLMLRLAQTMGLHRDSRKFDVEMSGYQIEIRRRLWNILTCVDLLESIRIGLPSLARADESDATLPSNIHDYEFDEDTTTLPPSRPISEHTPMSYIIAKTKIAGVFGRSVQIINRLHPVPSYDDILRLDVEARRVYAAVPDFLKFRPIEETKGDHPALIMQRYSLNILYQKTLMTLHRPYFTLRLKNNPRYGPSRRACLESAMTLLNHQYVIWDTEFNRKDKTFYQVDPLSSADFLPAAMIIMIELWQASTELKNNSGIFTMGRGDHEHMLKVLERTCHIYSTFPDIYEVVKAHGILSHLIEKVKIQFYSQAIRKPEAGPSPPDNHDMFSQPMSTTPDPSSDTMKDDTMGSEHSAAMTLGLLSSGGLTPLAQNPLTIPPEVSATHSGGIDFKTGLTPLYQISSPNPNPGISGNTSVPFSFFGQGIGGGFDAGANFGWDEWDNFLAGINSDPSQTWNLPMTPPGSTSLTTSDSNPESGSAKFGDPNSQWQSMIAPDPPSI